MYKITWSKSSDPFHITYILVPDAYALFSAYFVITGYGRNDGCSPINIKVTNLDGYEIDMSKGLANAASSGTYCSR